MESLASAAGRARTATSWRRRPASRRRRRSTARAGSTRCAGWFFWSVALAQVRAGGGRGLRQVVQAGAFPQFGGGKITHHHDATIHHDRPQPKMDPWSNSPPVKDYMRRYYLAMLKWLESGTGPDYKVQGVFNWNLVSWVSWFWVCMCVCVC